MFKSISSLERIFKIIFILMFAFYISIVSLGNVTNYNANYEYVKHVFLMDTTFKENQLMWRSISSPTAWTVAYISLICIEIITSILAWIGGIYMLKNFKNSSNLFHNSKKIALISLMLILIMWFFGFNTIGGEWFLMWQSKEWNGVDTARSMFTLVAIIFIYVTRKESENS